MDTSSFYIYMKAMIVSFGNYSCGFCLNSRLLLQLTLNLYGKYFCKISSLILHIDELERFLNSEEMKTPSVGTLCFSWGTNQIWFSRLLAKKQSSWNKMEVISRHALEGSNWTSMNAGFLAASNCWQLPTGWCVLNTVLLTFLA